MEEKVLLLILEPSMYINVHRVEVGDILSLATEDAARDCEFLIFLFVFFFSLSENPEAVWFGLYS